MNCNAYLMQNEVVTLFQVYQNELQFKVRSFGNFRVEIIGLLESHILLLYAPNKICFSSRLTINSLLESFKLELNYKSKDFINKFLAAMKEKGKITLSVFENATVELQIAFGELKLYYFLDSDIVSVSKQNYNLMETKIEEMYSLLTTIHSNEISNKLRLLEFNDRWNALEVELLRSASKINTAKQDYGEILKDKINSMPILVKDEVRRCYAELSHISYDRAMKQFYDANISDIMISLDNLKTKSEILRKDTDNLVLNAGTNNPFELTKPNFNPSQQLLGQGPLEPKISSTIPSYDIQIQTANPNISTLQPAYAHKINASPQVDIKKENGFSNEQQVNSQSQDKCQDDEVVIKSKGARKKMKSKAAKKGTSKEDIDALINSIPVESQEQKAIHSKNINSLDTKESNYIQIGNNKSSMIEKIPIVPLDSILKSKSFVRNGQESNTTVPESINIFKLNLKKVTNSNNSKINFDYTVKDRSSITYTMTKISDLLYASGGSDSLVYIRKLTNIEEIVNVCKKHTKPVESLCYFKNRNFLISGSADKSIVVWDLNTYAVMNVLLGHSGPVKDIVAIGENSIASCGEDGIILIWDLNYRVFNHKIKAHNSTINQLLFFQSYIVSVSLDKTYKIWNIKGDQPIEVDYYTDEQKFSCICIASQESAAIGCESGLIKIINIFKKIELGKLDGHTKWVNKILKLSFELIVSASADHTIKIWDFTNMNLVRNLEKHVKPVYCLLIFNDGGFLSSGGDNSIVVWSRI